MASLARAATVAAVRRAASSVAPVRAFAAAGAEEKVRNRPHSLFVPLPPRSEICRALSTHVPPSRAPPFPAPPSRAPQLEKTALYDLHVSLGGKVRAARGRGIWTLSRRARDVTRICHPLEFCRRARALTSFAPPPPASPFCRWCPLPATRCRCSTPTAC
jgi:hypothetical protein